MKWSTEDCLYYQLSFLFFFFCPRQIYVKYNTSIISYKTNIVDFDYSEYGI